VLSCGCSAHRGAAMNVVWKGTRSDTAALHGLEHVLCMRPWVLEAPAALPPCRQEKRSPPSAKKKRRDRRDAFTVLRRKRVVYVRKRGKTTAPACDDASLVEQNPQHAAQRLRGAPEQLIAHRECR
jgi:hypothetical protein